MWTTVDFVNHKAVSSEPRGFPTSYGTWLAAPNKQTNKETFNPSC